MKNRKGITLILLLTIAFIIVMLVFLLIKISMVSNEERLEMAAAASIDETTGEISEERLRNNLSRGWYITKNIDNTYTCLSPKNQKFNLSSKGKADLFTYQDLKIKSNKNVDIADLYDEKQFYIVDEDSDLYNGTMLHLGDYIDYPIIYTNNETLKNNYYWRVIGVENGQVKIVSVGIPFLMSYGQYSTDNKKIKNWDDINGPENFCKTWFYSGIPLEEHRSENGYFVFTTDYDLEEYKEQGEILYNSKYASDIRVMNVDDVYDVLNLDEAERKKMADLEEPKKVKFNVLNSISDYYIASDDAEYGVVKYTTQKDENGNITQYLKKTEGEIDTRTLYGVKVVAYLKPGTVTVGRDTNGIWRIFPPEN